MPRLLRICSNRRGVISGLLELLVSIVASTAIVGSLYVVSATGHRAWSTSMAAITVQDQLRLALDDIGNGLRNSGNESAAVHVRADEDAGCPTLIYQVPLIAAGYLGTTAAWGALDPPNDVRNDGAVWIHRADAPDGSGDGCTGPFLVRQLMTTWTNPGAAPAGAMSTRVLAAGVEAFQVQAYDADGQAVNWAEAYGGGSWTSRVKQVEVQLRLVQTAGSAPSAALEQLIRVQLRNRYRP